MLLSALRVAPVAAPMELVVVVNKEAQKAELSADEIRAIFLGRKRQWSDGRSIAVFNLPPGDALRSRFDEGMLGMETSKVARYWIDQRIRSGERPPRQVKLPALLVRLVERLPTAIAYIPAAMLTDKLRVVGRISTPAPTSQ